TRSAFLSPNSSRAFESSTTYSRRCIDRGAGGGVTNGRARFAFLLLASIEAAVLGLRIGGQARAHSGPWQSRSRPELGLGRAGSSARFSCLRARPPRPRQQRVGPGCAV